MLAVIDRERPAWVIGENVTGIDGMALEQVVSDLEAIGYDVSPPLEIPACGVGHDHWRPRLWFLAYADSDSEPVRAVNAEASGGSGDRSNAGSSGKKNGVPRGLDSDRRRQRALGNAVVPQIPELIGRAIAASMLEAAE
jgi:DNA (cytosine-5)-methyltransferase 1